MEPQFWQYSNIFSDYQQSTIVSTTLATYIVAGDLCAGTDVNYKLKEKKMKKKKKKMMMMMMMIIIIIELIKWLFLCLIIIYLFVLLTLTGWQMKDDLNDILIFYAIVGTYEIIVCAVTIEICTVEAIISSNFVHH